MFILEKMLAFITKWILLFSLLFCINTLFAQRAIQPPDYSIKPVVSAIDTFANRMASEKIFIHSDKSFYTIGDTLWFKSYLLDAGSLAFSRKSGVIYVELFSEGGKLINRVAIPVYKGMAWGQLPLPDTDLPEGFYILRAYTNWMQNFGTDSFFTKRIYIADTRGTHWVVSQANKWADGQSKSVLAYSLKFSNAGNRPFGFKKINWKLFEGKRLLDKGVFESLNNSLQGTVSPTFQNGALGFVVEENNKDYFSELKLPVILPDSVLADVRFMPEGGYLVAGVPGSTAFKAIDVTGHGLSVEGIVRNRKNEEVATFKSEHKGMGTFSFTPELNEEYAVEIKDGRSAGKTFKLPAVQPEGAVLQVLNSPDSDSIRVYVSYSKGRLNNQSDKLLGVQGGKVKFYAVFEVKKQRFFMKIPKSLFNTGVVHFTLFNHLNEPVNERQIFVNKKDFLNIELNVLNKSNKKRDSVSAQIKVRDARGQALKGYFSVSVTDNSQVKQKDNEFNILSSVYLDSDLQGVIEDAGWYFNGSKEADEYIDLLMLTHGWVGYKWNQIVKPGILPDFKAEPGSQIVGRVTNFSGKPVPGAKITLFSSGKTRVLLDTLADQEGEFTFTNLPVADSVVYFVQSTKKNNKAGNLNVSLDEFRPAVFKNEIYPLETPWFVNADSVQKKLAQNIDKLRMEDLASGKVLKEVVIRNKRVKNSNNLNGAGQADQILEEQDFADQPKVNLLDILFKKVKNLSVRIKGNDQYFYLLDHPVNFVIDGINLSRLFLRSESPAPMENYRFVSNILKDIKGEDLLGVELMASQRYTSTYAQQNLGADEVMSRPGQAFVEITTRSGNGIKMQTNHNIALLKPLPLTWPKDFYQPKYKLSGNLSGSDLRSTIAWVPNVLTDEKGNGSFSFFSSDVQGEYTVIIQGSNMFGDFGYKMQLLKVGGK